MTKRPFTIKEVRAKECLELGQTNMCESFNVHVHREYEYFITITDDYSRYDYVYLLHRKSDVLH